MTVTLEGDSLVLAVTENNVVAMQRVAGHLAVALEGKRTKWGRPRFLSPMSLFPEAYESRREQKAYVQRHESDVRADLTAAAHRVIAALEAGLPVRYPAAEADDLLRVFGSARLLFGDRDTPLDVPTEKISIASYLTAVQQQIVVALRPELVRKQ